LGRGKRENAAQAGRKTEGKSGCSRREPSIGPGGKEGLSPRREKKEHRLTSGERGGAIVVIQKKEKKRGEGVWVKKKPPDEASDKNQRGPPVEKGGQTIHSSQR